MPDPLISIVVPTHGHRETLVAAVQSCLGGETGRDTEILVLPNGGGNVWQTTLGGLLDEPRVSVHPVPSGNANAARNLGMSLARGRYLRFLDDDDLLYSYGTSAQVEMLDRTNADVCSGPIDLLRKDGTPFGEALQPPTPDFPAAVLCSKRMVQVTAHLFRRSALRQVRWNEALDFTQDIEWFMNLCARDELRWVKTDQRVGGWRRHTDKRTSTNAPLNARKKIVAHSVIALTELLDRQGRLTLARRLAAADGLWECVHASYFLEPRYWRAIAKVASTLAPASYPDIRLQRLRARALLDISPVRLEAAIAPKRLLAYGLRRMGLRLGLLETW